MKKVLLSALAVILSVLTYGQSSPQTEKCGTALKTQERIAKNPELLHKRASIEQQMQNWIANESKNKVQAVITIPVVVHILYKNTAENISMAQIQSQIDVLNEDFRKLNADFSTVTPLPFQAVAADCELEFCLTDTDPQGNLTNGVTRTSVPQNFDVENDYFDPAFGGKSSWDHTKYLNIWVGQLGTQLLGFATQPGMAGPSDDGLVIDVDAFGTVGLAASNQPNHLGRTTVHEVGHYFNLEHTWGVSGGCGDDDFVSDTPNQNDESSGCSTFPLTDICTPGGNGVMFVNFMDYSDDPCLTMFTQGQKQRMLAAINTSRTGLLNTSLCGPAANDPVSLTELSLPEFDLLPNPSSDYIIIDIKESSAEYYNLQIVNTIGAVVLDKQIGNTKERIDLTSYSNGIYSVNVSRNGRTSSKLLVIE